MLEFASGRVDPLNLFMNISRGSDILGKGSNPLAPGKYSPCFYSALNGNITHTIDRF